VDLLLVLIILLLILGLGGGYLIGHMLYWLLVIALVLFIARIFSGGRRY
jgi:hypothetical protein